MDASSTKWGLSRYWLIASNLIMSMAWARVLCHVIFFLAAMIRRRDGDDGDDADDPLPDSWCDERFVPSIVTALCASFLEVLNASIGLTRSRPHQVLLFSAVRFGVEVLAAPMLDSRTAWQHLLTVACWSLGDAIRFACFAVDSSSSSSSSLGEGIGGRAKEIRYAVGPLLFPVGALGEMLIIVRAAASDGRSHLYLVAALWPLGFYPLFARLLEQRRRFYERRRLEKSASLKAE